MSKSKPTEKFQSPDLKMSKNHFLSPDLSKISRNLSPESSKIKNFLSSENVENFLSPAVPKYF